MIDWLNNHKREVTITGIVLIIIILLLLIKSCSTSKPETTNNPKLYEKHVTETLDELEDYEDNLLLYLGRIGKTRALIDCDEDVAVQLKAFAVEFSAKSDQYDSLTYIGSEVIVGMDNYNRLSEHYKTVSKTLEKLASSVSDKDTETVRATFEVLKTELLKVREGEQS
ncbi:MAG: hypothetical protein RR565_06640 [Erysipelothrix sp.]